MKKSINISGRRIGFDEPPYVIAELSGNHNGKISRALELVDAAKDAGADAVKMQTYTADTLTLDHDGPDFLIRGGLWNGRTLYELYQEASTPWAWHGEIFAAAARHGINCFSSPFDETAVDFLETLGAPAYKIASFEIVDLELIAKAARTGKPLIISTGMANAEEIEDALRTARASGADGVALLHCVSGYPTPVEDMNLARIHWLAEQYDCVVGLSDHTLGPSVPIAAAALGACIVEKHITLCRADGGPDSAFSLEPHEFKDLVDGVRMAHLARGTPVYGRAPSEAGNLIFRRSLYVVDNVRKGDPFTGANVRSIRPGFGLPPKLMPVVLGKRATRDIERGTALSADMIEAWEV